MSTEIIGFRPPDETWQKMKAVYDTCTAASVPVPECVQKFFDYKAPSTCGIEVDLEGIARPWKDDTSEGFEISTKELPDNITMIRFCNSW